MTNVIPFKKKKEVFVLKFKTADVIKFSKRDEHKDIMLEMQQNKGTAWVPALNLNDDVFFLRCYHVNNLQ